MKGIISNIRGKDITIRIQCQSACVHCSLHNTCPIDIKEKSITIKQLNAKHYKIGQEVYLSLSKKSMVLSLLFAYGIPLLLMLGTVFLGIKLNWSDTLIGIMALAGLIPYYILLFIFNSYLKKYFMILISENPVD